MRTPHFGDQVVNNSASECNPTKHGLFVRRVTRSGVMNPGEWWELTNGEGSFWRTQADAYEVVTPATSSERLERRSLALAGELYTLLKAGSLGTTATETAVREVGGLEMLATLLNKDGAFNDVGLSFASALIEEVREWVAEISQPEEAA
jgi:hypothetical protein